jgi:hypothetical protein
MQRICEQVTHLNEGRDVQTHSMNAEEEVNNFLYLDSFEFVT